MANSQGTCERDAQPLDSTETPSVPAPRGCSIKHNAGPLRTARLHLPLIRRFRA